MKKKMKKKMKKRIKALLIAFTMVLMLSRVYVLPVQASEGEEPKQLVINGVDFSNLDINNFKLSDLTVEQIAVIKDILEMYGMGDMEWNLGALGQDVDNDSPEVHTQAEKRGTGSATGTSVVTSDDLEGAMEFVKITTKDDQMFYLVIDYTQEEDNVYFLDLVTVNDLFRIAETETDADENPIYVDYSQFKEKTETGQEEGDESNLQESGEKEENEAAEVKTGAPDDRVQNLILILGIVFVGGIAFVVIYVMKVKNKKIDEDKDDFSDLSEDDQDDDDSNDSYFAETPYEMEESEESEITEPSELVDIDSDEEQSFVEDDETDDQNF